MTLELTGKIILTLAILIGVLAAALIGPVLGNLIRIILWVPGKLTDLFMNGLGKTYPAFLRRTLAHPFIVLLAVGLTGFGTWQMIRGMDSELLPEVHQGEFTVEVALPVGTPLEETEAILAPIESVFVQSQRCGDFLSGVNIFVNDIPVPD